MQLSDTSLISSGNLVAYYKMENTSDTKGGASFTNVATTFGAGKYNNAAIFTTSSQLQLSALPGFQTVSDSTFSISCWIKPGAVNTYILTFEKPNMKYYEVTITPSSNLQVFGADGFGGLDLLASNKTIPLNVWTHIGVTLSTNEACKIYINGVLDNQKNLGIPGDSRNNGEYFYVGGGNYIGRVDDLAIFDATISATDMLLLGGDTNGASFIYNLM